MTGAVEPAPLALMGDGAFALKIAGVSYHQDELNMLFGPKKPRSLRLPVDLELVPEPANPHDPNAVAVVIDGVKVGYVPRTHASELRHVWPSSAPRVRASAMVVGGWFDDAGREGHYGLRLDATVPLTIR